MNDLKFDVFDLRERYHFHRELQIASILHVSETSLSLTQLPIQRYVGWAETASLGVPKFEVDMAKLQESCRNQLGSITYNLAPRCS